MLVKTWLLIGCDTAFYAIIQFRIHCYCINCNHATELAGKQKLMCHNLFSRITVTKLHKLVFYCHSHIPELMIPPIEAPYLQSRTKIISAKKTPKQFKYLPASVEIRQASKITNYAQCYTTCLSSCGHSFWSHTFIEITLFQPLFQVDKLTATGKSINTGHLLTLHAG